jgi:uncharacterized protein YdcH (DUF465 family)
MIKKTLIAGLVIAGATVFAAPSKEVLGARKDVHNTYCAAQKLYKDDPAYSELGAELRKLNSAIRDYQTNAGLTPEVNKDHAAKRELIIKLKADPAYIKLTTDKADLEKKIKELFLVKDPAYKAAVEKLKQLSD